MDFLPRLLENKRVILGLSGSVSIYKALEVLRLLQKLGANVRCVMSESAKEFINPLLFEALSHFKVLDSKSQDWGQNPNNHIEICTWGDVFLLCPASANTINKIANGIADNVLLESFLAFDKIKIIAPSANTKMLENPLTQKSLKILDENGVKIIASQCKELACKTIGNGGLAEPFEIVYTLLREVSKKAFFINKNVLITGGGSKERVDSVRYISNDSSGRMAQSLALIAYFLGAKVTYLGSAFPYILPLKITQIKVEESKDFLKEIEAWQKGKTREDSYLFMAAAISDFICKEPSKEKLKKESIGKEWSLHLVQNTDILKNLDKTKQKTIGFKLESENGMESARKSLENKNLDAVCLNNITNLHNPMNSDSNQIFWITKKAQKDLGFSDKITLAFKILSELENL